MPDEHLDANVFAQYKKDPKAWEAQAKQWAEVYAPNNTELKVKKVGWSRQLLAIARSFRCASCRFTARGNGIRCAQSQIGVGESQLGRGCCARIVATVK